MTVEIALLGGVGEFGRNCLVIDDGGLGAALVVDCGLKVTERGAAEPYVDVPDLDALARLRERVAGYALTHGHDDHIGGLPEAMRVCPAPVYGARFTRARVRQRFRRSGRATPELMAVEPGASRRIGPFDVEWVAVSHSIPDAAALLVRTSEGVVLHSGDFRVDDDPLLGPPTDLSRLARAGNDGVTLLLSDSTGAPLEGENPGEQSVRLALDAAFEGVDGRVLVTTFATHIQRLQLVADICRARGRRLFPVGRGMREAFQSAQALGLLRVDDVVMAEGELYAVHPRSACLVATGSQAERGSALWRIARGEHGRVRLGPGDRVVFSARTIPGNEAAVDDAVARLGALGVSVLDGGGGRHVSGHGHAGDLGLLLDVAVPRWFLALHGEERHLEAHRRLAVAHGVDEGRVLRAVNGERVVLEGGRARVAAD